MFANIFFRTEPQDGESDESGEHRVHFPGAFSNKAVVCVLKKEEILSHVSFIQTNHEQAMKADNKKFSPANNPDHHLQVSHIGVFILVSVAGPWPNGAATKTQGVMDV